MIGSVPKTVGGGGCSMAVGDPRFYSDYATESNTKNLTSGFF